ncbi:hypothetical protein IMCC1989_1913 [gamma proteobacterium IMCC1989]|nr:hypothetical protein IMCC1989_1913 [gamma proteobacterium IMCC1989]
MPAWIHNKTLRLWIPPIAGFLFYGAWAFFINFSHGWDSAITAAVTQGGYSFTITLVLALVIEFLFQRLSDTSITALWRNVWVFIAGFSLLLFTSVGINLLTGTPEIFWTVLPGLTVSAVYTVMYILTLNKVEG